LHIPRIFTKKPRHMWHVIDGNKNKGSVQKSHGHKCGFGYGYDMDMGTPSD